jgi:ribosomal protein S18 acetylase RimI-like enzyme
MRHCGERPSVTGKKMPEWTISPLTKIHDRAEFSCGKASLDSFLRSHVTQYEKRRLARTYVATELGSTKVAGYYTLAAGALDASVLPEALRKKLPEHPIPTAHLARLAVDSSYKGKRLGERLLLHALDNALESAKIMGVFGVDVWAIDEQASAFYQKYGFTSLADDPHHLLLATKTIEATTNP